MKVIYESTVYCIMYMFLVYTTCRDSRVESSRVPESIFLIKYSTYFIDFNKFSSVDRQHYTRIKIII